MANMDEIVAGLEAAAKLLLDVTKQLRVPQTLQSATERAGMTPLTVEILEDLELSDRNAKLDWDQRTGTIDDDGWVSSAINTVGSLCAVITNYGPPLSNLRVSKKDVLKIRDRLEELVSIPKAVLVPNTTLVPAVPVRDDEDVVMRLLFIGETLGVVGVLEDHASDEGEPDWVYARYLLADLSITKRDLSRLKFRHIACIANGGGMV